MQFDRRFYVYIMTNKPWGTLYVGVTNNIFRRVYEHRSGELPGFTQKYALRQLVFFEQHGSADSSISREKRIKKWPRSWEINLVRTDNPDWIDLAADWYTRMSAEEITAWLADVAQQ
jgi:putative endonuclease